MSVYTHVHRHTPKKFSWDLKTLQQRKYQDSNTEENLPPVLTKYIITQKRRSQRSLNVLKIIFKVDNKYKYLYLIVSFISNTLRIFIGIY